jgi:hypothetical protein
VGAASSILAETTTQSPQTSYFLPSRKDPVFPGVFSPGSVSAGGYSVDLCRFGPPVSAAEIPVPDRAVNAELLASQQRLGSQKIGAVCENAWRRRHSASEAAAEFAKESKRPVEIA